MRRPTNKMSTTPPLAIQLDGNSLTFIHVHSVSRVSPPALQPPAQVSLSQSAREKMLASRAVVDRVVLSNKTTYGVNTGFGELAEVRISQEQVRQLQLNLSSQPLLRSRRSTFRNRNARDDAASREHSCQRIFRSSPAHRRNSLRNVESRSSPSNSLSRFRRRFR